MIYPSQEIKNIISHIWHRLTKEEIEACAEERDVFFIAVRKKHGMARAQAELFLHDLDQRINKAA